MRRNVLAIVAGLIAGFALTAAGQWAANVALPVGLAGARFAPLSPGQHPPGPFGDTTLDLVLQVPLTAEVGYAASCMVGALIGAALASRLARRGIGVALIVGGILAGYEAISIAEIPKSWSFSVLVAVVTFAAAAIGGMRWPLSRPPHT